MIIEIGTWKNQPIMVFKRSEDDAFPFSFGIRKAQIIVENIKRIQEFVDKYGEKE